MTTGKFIRHLPALAVGLLLAQISVIVFSYTATYMLEYLTSVADLNGNSIQYLWLILHDVSLVLVLSACAYFGYRTLLTKFPDDLYAAILMQLPQAYLVLYLMPASLNFSSLYSSTQSVTAIVSSISVLVVYSLSTLVRQRVKRLT